MQASLIKILKIFKKISLQARSTLVRTEVAYENAKIALDDTVVRSPISGTIISRPVEVGQVISSPTSAVGGGTLLMTMADLSKVSKSVS